MGCNLCWCRWWFAVIKTVEANSSALCTLCHFWPIVWYFIYICIVSVLISVVLWSIHRSVQCVLMCQLHQKTLWPHWYVYNCSGWVVLLVTSKQNCPCKSAPFSSWQGAVSWKLMSSFSWNLHYIHNPQRKTPNVLPTELSSSTTVHWKMRQIKV